jgi:hypothetical protein
VAPVASVAVVGTGGTSTARGCGARTSGDTTLCCSVPRHASGRRELGDPSAQAGRAPFSIGASRRRGPPRYLITKGCRFDERAHSKLEVAAPWLRTNSASNTGVHVLAPGARNCFVHDHPVRFGVTVSRLLPRGVSRSRIKSEPCHRPLAGGQAGSRLNRIRNTALRS